MGFFDKFVDAGGSKILDSYGKDLANRFLTGIAAVKSVRLENKKPVAVITLEGMEERDIIIKVGMISINEEGTKLMLGDFSSDMPFVENALNRYAARTIEVKDPKVIMALKALSKVL